MFSGDSVRSAGMEPYQVTPTEAQFVRIVGYGNSRNSWNSILEVEVTGTVK